MVFYFTTEKSDKFVKPLTCKGLRLKKELGIKDYAVPAVCYPFSLSLSTDDDS